MRKAAIDFGRRVRPQDHQRRIARQAQHDEGEGDDEQDGQRRRAAGGRRDSAASGGDSASRLRRSRWQAARPAVGQRRLQRRRLDSAARDGVAGSADGRRSRPDASTGLGGSPGSTMRRRLLRGRAPGSPRPAPACRDAPAARTDRRARPARRCGRDTSRRPVADLPHHAQIVADEQVGQPELLPAGRAAGSPPAPGSRRRAPRSARRRPGDPARWPARAPARRAGAGRRTARAG